MENLNKVINMSENSLDSSRRFENLEEELLYYQLEYFERIDKGLINPLHEKFEGSDESVKSYIYESSEYVEYLTDEYRKKRGEGIFEDSAERKTFEEWKDRILKEIIDDYKSGNKKWRENAILKIQENLEKIEKNSNAKEKLKVDNDYRKEAGLINFNLTKTLGGYESFGLKEKDDCISIHFENLFDQKNKKENIVNIFSGESLSQLAVLIAEEFPQVRAILAESWIVGSPIGKRIGFTILEEYKDQVVGGGRFWGQFFNENGSIKKDEMRRFLETGIPKYYLTEGFIKTEDFLKKYLPKEKRGFIKLKEKTEESRFFEEDFEVMTERIKFDWDKLSFDEILSIMTNRNTILANYFKTVDGKEYLKMIKIFKESGLKPMDDFVYDSKDEIKKKFDDFIKEKSNQYIEKEVFIP